MIIIPRAGAVVMINVGLAQARPIKFLYPSQFHVCMLVTYKAVESNETQREVQLVSKLRYRPLFKPT